MTNRMRVPAWSGGRLVRRAAFVVFVSAVVALLVCGGDAAVGRSASARSDAGFLVTVSEEPLLSQSKLELVSGDGSLIRVVATVGWGAVSPNGRLIAWEGPDGIHIEHLDGSHGRLLVPLSCPKLQPSYWYSGCGDGFVWSPDSRRLLIQDRDHGLSIAPLSGSRHRVVTPRRHVSYDPVAWSASGILFTAYNAGGANGSGCCSEKLIISRPTGASRRTLYDAADPIHDSPGVAVSPNGRWIAFTTEARDTRDPRLAIVNAKTGAMTRIRRYRGFDQPPAWSPDSSRFLAGGYQMPFTVFSTTGREIRSLNGSAPSPDLLAWTAGGIYFLSDFDAQSEPRQLVVVPPRSRQARTILTLPEGQILLRVQPF